MDSLIQKTFFLTKQISLGDSFISVSEKSISKVESWVIYYEDLGVNIYSKRDRPLQAIIIFGLLLFFFSAGFIYLYTSENEISDSGIILLLGSLLWCFLLVLVCIKSLHWKKYLMGGKNSIELFANAPDEKTVDDFINNIIDKRKKFYFEKYIESELGRMDTHEMLNVLNWFKRINVISSTEYSTIKGHYEGEKKSIKGFTSLEDSFSENDSLN